MYKLAGYCIENTNVFCARRADAVKACIENNLDQSLITQLFKMERLPYTEPAATPKLQKKAKKKEKVNDNIQ